MTETKKPGYREQGKARAGNVKNNFAINPEQMEFERRKLLEQMSSKMSPNKKFIPRHLLCQKHNLAYGMFEENIVQLKRAIKYKRKYG